MKIRETGNGNVAVVSSCEREIGVCLEWYVKSHYLKADGVGRFLGQVKYYANEFDLNAVRILQ